MILAAGEGRRLRPLTETVPKALVEVGGKPLIEYAVETLARCGIRDVIVNLHHLGERIRAHLGDGERWGVRLRYSEEQVLLGSGGGIVHARTLLGDERFVTLNSDTIVDVDVAEVVRAHEAARATATLVLRKDPRMEEFGVIAVERDGRIGKFLRHERPGASLPLEPYMYTGVQVLEPRVFDFMPDAGAFSITEQTYPRMLAAGERLFGVPFAGRWITVGTPAELEHARKVLEGKTLDSREGSRLS
jgi:NDP-sugar pyrophosphorylase family protein